LIFYKKKKKTKNFYKNKINYLIYNFMKNKKKKKRYYNKLLLLLLLLVNIIY